MRKLVFAILFSLTGTALAGALVGHNPQTGENIRLLEMPCTGLVATLWAEQLAKLPPDEAAQFKPTAAEYRGPDGAVIKGCWVLHGDHADLIYEDGDAGSIPLRALHVEETL